MTPWKVTKCYHSMRPVMATYCFQVVMFCFRFWIKIRIIFAEWKTASPLSTDPCSGAAKLVQLSISLKYWHSTQYNAEYNNLHGVQLNELSIISTGFDNCTNGVQTGAVCCLCHGLLVLFSVWPHIKAQWLYIDHWCNARQSVNMQYNPRQLPVLIGQDPRGMF